MHSCFLSRLMLKLKETEKKLWMVTFLLIIWKNCWKQFNLSNLCCRCWAQFTFYSTFSETRRFSSKERNYSSSGSIIRIGYDQIMAKKKHTERSSGHDMEKNNRYRITNDRSEWGQKIMNKYHYKWEQEQIHMGRMLRSNLCCLFLPITLKNVYANWNLSIFAYSR